jgi:hypothetical protein
MWLGYMGSLLLQSRRILRRYLERWKHEAALWWRLPWLRMLGQIRRLTSNWHVSSLVLWCLHTRRLRIRLSWSSETGMSWRMLCLLGSGTRCELRCTVSHIRLERRLELRTGSRATLQMLLEALVGSMLTCWGRRSLGSWGGRMGLGSECRIRGWLTWRSRGLRRLRRSRWLRRRLFPFPLGRRLFLPRRRTWTRRCDSLASLRKRRC